MTIRGISINLSCLNQNKRRREWFKGIKGLMTVLRVLPEDLCNWGAVSGERLSNLEFTSYVHHLTRWPAGRLLGHIKEKVAKIYLRIVVGNQFTGFQ